MSLRDTEYATELATASIPGSQGRIERIHVKMFDHDEIRFSWWPDENRMAPRPLDLPEHELLPLFAKAIESNVFSDDFLRELHLLLTKRAWDRGKRSSQQ